MMRMSAKFTVAVGVCLVVFALSAQPARADDAFAKITGSSQGLILGDQPEISLIPDSKDGVQVFSTGFELKQNFGKTGGGVLVPVGPPVVSELQLTKRFDRASPKLLRAAFTGESLSIEIIWFMIFQAVARKTVSIKLDDARITMIQAAANLQGNDASGFESVSLVFSRMTFTTPILDPKTGKVTGQSSVCLDGLTGNIC